MKKLLSLLVAAVLLPVAANADILSNVKLIGEVQTIASDVKHNTGDEDFLYNRGAKTRALAGLSFDVVEDVTANVLFQYAYNWGDNNYTNNGFQNADGMKLVNANLVLHNLLCAFEATIGRQFYGEDGSTVIYFGPNHYNAEGMGYAPALDAVTVRYNDDFKSVTLIAGKVADVTNGLLMMEAQAQQAPAGYHVDLRSNIFGGDLKLNLTDALTANVYGYDFANPAEVEVYNGQTYIDPVDSDSKHVGVYGARLGLTTDAFRAGAEYNRNFAGHRLIKEPKDIPYMIKADIAADIKAVTARGTFVYSKEGFFSLGNYAPGLIFGHPMSNYWMEFNPYNFTDNGLRLFNVGFDVKPAEKWTVSLDAFSFQDRQGRHSATYEADLTAKYAYNNYVEMFAGFGYAKNGHEWNFFNEGRSENYKGQLGMLVKF